MVPQTPGRLLVPSDLAFRSRPMYMGSFLDVHSLSRRLYRDQAGAQKHWTCRRPYGLGSSDTTLRPQIDTRTSMESDIGARMDLSEQKWLRFIIPGVMLYVLLVLLCWTTNWCMLTLPTSIAEISKLLASLAFGFLYAVSGLRELSNKFYHEKVRTSICDLLIEPFVKSDPALDRITWKKIKPIFYSFIDNDKSLEKQSKIIRWNGLLWTSAADLRACSVIGALVFGIAIVLGYHVNWLAFDFGRAGYAITGLLILYLSSFVWSSQLTEKHRRLGMEQCEYILIHRRNELSEMLNLALRS
jgi:hypothetical protein